MNWLAILLIACLPLVSEACTDPEVVEARKEYFEAFEKEEKEKAPEHSGWPHQCPACQYWIDRGYGLGKDGETIKLHNVSPD